MKLASLKGGRDGRLVVVDKSMEKCLEVGNIAPTLQNALDHWVQTEPKLQAIYQDLNDGKVQGDTFDPEACESPLPRAYHWADGSAYVNHVELVRKARNAVLPDSFWTDPLMYQGGSDTFIGPREDIEIVDEAWGIDLEAELAVITDDVPMGVASTQVKNHIKLVMLVNDVSLRNLIPGELAKGFGFYQSKPSSAFSPVAITPDEINPAGDLDITFPMLVRINGEAFGKARPDIDRTFDFADLVSHAAKSRHLGPGTIIGSGTISNKLDGGPGKTIAEGGVGYACIAEQRCVETILNGKPTTEFLKFGDVVEIEMQNDEGESLFGTIKQKVARYIGS